MHEKFSPKELKTKNVLNVTEMRETEMESMYKSKQIQKQTAMGDIKA